MTALKLKESFDRARQAMAAIELIYDHHASSAESSKMTQEMLNLLKERAKNLVDSSPHEGEFYVGFAEVVSNYLHPNK